MFRELSSVLGYIITVNMSAASPMLHRAPNPATLTCEVALTGAFNDELAMEMTWSKDGVTLPGVPHHHTPDEAPTRQPNATVHFESALTLRSLKPSDNGTYICSAFVVSRTERHPLSSPVAASLDIQVLGEWEDCRHQNIPCVAMATPLLMKWLWLMRGVKVNIYRIQPPRQGTKM